MKVNLHNKVEIVQGDKVITAYNTMLKGVYSAIAELKDYFKYMAVGTGSGESNFNSGLLENCVGAYLLKTEEASCDIKNSELFVKKVITFGESEENGLEFCEIGITDSISDNPTIYNRILIKDDDGNVLTVTKRQGEALTVRITIYLEIDEASKPFFTTGNNGLLLQFMGESGASDKNIYAMRGLNSSGNESSIQRICPAGDKILCLVEKSGAEESDFMITIKASLGSKEAREVLFIYGEDVVMRASIAEFGKEENQEITFTLDENGYFDAGKHLINFSGVSVNDTGASVASDAFEVVKIAKNLGEGKKGLPNFDKAEFKPTENSEVIMSADGRSFLVTLSFEGHAALFMADSNGLVPYSYAAYCNTNSIMVRLIGSRVFYFDKQLKLFRVQEFTNDSVRMLSINTDELEDIYDFSTIEDFDCVINKNGRLIIGMVLSLESGKKIGVLASFEENDVNAGWKMVSYKETIIDGVGKVLAANIETYEDGKIMFFANSNLTTANSFETEILSESTSEILADTSVATYAFSDKLGEIDACGDFIVFKLTDPSFNSMVAYDIVKKQWTSFQANSLFGYHYEISKDGKYLARKPYNSNYDKLLFKDRYDNFTEFEDSFVADSSIRKIILTKDLVVLFKYLEATKSYYFEAYTYDECYSVLKNVDLASKVLKGTFTHRKYLGDGALEGVEAKISLSLAPPVIEG